MKRRRLSLVVIGTIVSWGALLTYFLVVPRWPLLRDTGHLNVALAVAGTLLGVIGLRRCFAARAQRVGGSILFALGAIVAAFLAFYIYYLSYQLPTADNVLAAGVKAPSFRLADQSGAERRLEEFSGRRLALVFFRGHW